MLTNLRSQSRGVQNAAGNTDREPRRRGGKQPQMGVLGTWMPTEDMEWESVKKGERMGAQDGARGIPAFKRWAEKELVRTVS